MKRKLTFFIVSMLVSVVSFAQWTKPAAPAVTAMSVGDECYLYNKEADGFLVGANDWGTRASVSDTLGHKVYLEVGAVDGSYYITNFVLQGGMANQIGYMFIDGPEAIWVDNTKDGKTDNQYTFEANGDGTYKIGLSSANKTYNPTDFPDAYLGLIPSKNDTRIYICDPENSGGYTMDECYLTWYFVSPAEYETYIKAKASYNAATDLAAVIAEAESTNGVDASVIATAKSVYNNTSSTSAQLNTQKAILETAIFHANLEIASVANPIEVLASLGIATDFTDGTCPGWSSTTGASNKQASNGNNALDYSVTGNHYENWNWEAFTTGKVTANATGLPTGVYHLNALAYSTTVGGTYLYAGEISKLVTSTKIDISQPMDLYAVVTDGTISIGLDVREKGTNWIGLDNVYLYYLGNGEDAYAALSTETINAEPDYEALFSEEEAFCQKSVYDAYLTAKEVLQNAKTAEEATTALSAFATASNNLAGSVAAYASYIKKCEEAEQWLESSTSESEQAILLSDYLMDDTEAAGLYNGNGGYPYILASGLLDNTQIAAEAEYADKLLKDAMANSMSDGDDCTELLKNPNFAETGGWSGANTTNITWPAGNTEVYPVMQAHNVACNIYQELTGLQNGLYEFTLQGAFRPGSGYTEEEEAIAQAYAYINSYEAKVPSGNIEGDVTLNEAEEASTAFSEGKFPITVYGLVTDGTMKIGITNKVRTVENCRLWAGGAKLIFRAKNMDVLDEVIGKTTPVANELLNSYAGNPELSALSDAISAAQLAEDPYDALVNLKAAMEAVEQGTTTYANLLVAINSLKDAIENNTKADVTTIANAQALFEEADAAYKAQTYSTEEAEKVISDLNAMTVAVKLGISNASEENPEDYSSAIVNNNFDPARGDKNSSTIEGWETTTLNGYKEYTCSYNKNTFALSQKLSGLPKGKYKVTVHTFYRAGSYDEEANFINSGVDTHRTILYAATADETYEKAVMNLSEGGVTSQSDVPEGAKTTTINGIIVPDGTSASVAFFNAGYYLNELEFMVGDDGEVTIGMHLDETIGSNDYVVIGEWNLWYMGDPSASGEQDVSDLIVNNNFDPARGDKNTSTIEGWETTTLNGYKEYTCSYNKNTFALSQKLSGLPKGKYKVTVHTFYRAGSYDEEANFINSGVDTHRTILYAATADETYEKAVMNLSEGGVTSQSDVPEGAKTTTINGIIVPDGTSASVAFFNAGYYLNELEFTVGDDGEVTIGMHLDETIGSNDYVVVGKWSLYYLGDSDAINEQDVSELIVNNKFDPARGDKNSSTIEGWETTTLNGYKEYTCSYNKNTFALSQALSGLPEGTYKVTVHTFYRAGSYDEESNFINSGVDTHRTKLYAATSETTYETSVMNLSEGGVTSQSDVPEGAKTTTINGIIVPDGTSASVAFFNAGYYVNELLFYVGNDGKATIGMYLNETIGSNDYVVVGEWNLYYYGSGNVIDQLDPTAVESIKTDAPATVAVPVAYYSISGAKINAPQKGINIVKMSDNSVRKVLVK